jgi:hypothetical protein
MGVEAEDVKVKELSLAPQFTKFGGQKSTKFPKIYCQNILNTLHSCRETRGCICIV